ncbi:MAG: energy transducer TonB [Gammaproteobacteria bacterium]|nr:energy transducer TonB [Gammaproteobacteria bacterium]
MIALVLSGLVHGLFMFDGVNDEPSMQSPEVQEHSLHLEFVIEEKAASRKPKQEVAREISHNPVITQQKITDKQVLKRSEKNKKWVEKAQHEQQVNTFEDQHEQKKQINKSVENHDLLMQLVYQAINKYKAYPYMARRLGQQGKVTLKFVMHPDGLVTDVVVIGSSQYSVLDNAARQAVSAISPFAMAADYLSYEKVFDIAVDFRLN